MAAVPPIYYDGLFGLKPFLTKTKVNFFAKTVKVKNEVK